MDLEDAKGYSISSSTFIWQSKTSTSLEWSLGFFIGTWTSLIGENYLIGVFEAWEDLGRVESGSEHGVVEQEDGRLWSWQGSLDSISMKFFSWSSIGSMVQVVAWSWLGEDVRPCGMNEEGHGRSKGPWNGSETSWK